MKSEIGTLPGFCFLLLAFWLLPSAAIAADLSARRMEIIQTPEGQVTVFRDSVVIVDGTTVIQARLARFNESRGVAVVSDSVRIESRDAFIRADSAVYQLETRVTELFGRVEVEIESLTITAPHLLYYVGEQRVDAGHGLSLRTGKEGMRLQGERGRYFIASRVGEVDSSPSVLLGSPGDDSVTATSRSMTWFSDSETALLTGEVRVGSGNSALTADSLLYWTGQDTGVAWGTPRLMVVEGGTEGDTVRLYVREGSLHKVEVSGTARGRYMTAGSGDIDVAGQLIRIRLDGNELEVVEVERMTHGRLVRRSDPAGETD